MESVSPISTIEQLSASSSIDCSKDESNGPSSEGFDDSRSDSSKQAAWNNKNKHLVVESGGLAMDADLWPALSDSTKSSSKSSLASVKPHSNGSVSAPISQVIEITPSSLKQGSNSKKSNSTLNQASLPMRQKSIKRQGGGAAANGVLAQPPSDSGPSVEIAYSNNSTNTRNSTWENGQKAVFHGGNDHHHPPNFGRRGNNGSYPRGDGSYNQNYGGRRDQDRQNRYSNRDGNMHSLGMPRSSVRPVLPPAGPPRGATFSSHHPMPPFLPPMPIGYPEMYGGMPFVPQIFVPPIFYYPAPAGPQAMILNQIEYYFSETNLAKDVYLRQHMNEEGWVPISVIANFKKIMEMTDNIPLILDSIQNSTVVEVQMDKVRKRNDWGRFPPLPVGTNTHALFNHFRNINLENNAQTSSESSALAIHTR